MFVTADARTRHADLVAAATGAGVEVQVVSGEVMSELAQTVTPQGLLAICEFVDVPLDQLDNSKMRLAAVLANVRDPGNAGTVLRTADAAGADAVVFADASVDPYNGKCVRASAGSLFHLPVVAGVRLTDAVGALKRAGLRIVAADGRSGVPLDDPETRAALKAPTAWLFGNEAWGLPRRTARARGPVRGGADLRPGGEPEPRRGRRGVPVRVSGGPALNAPIAPPITAEWAIPRRTPNKKESIVAYCICVTTERNPGPGTVIESVSRARV